MSVKVLQDYVRGEAQQFKEARLTRQLHSTMGAIKREVVSMSLIPCPECGKEISSSTNKCPHCGYNIPRNYSLVISLTIVAILVVVGVIVYLNSDYHKMLTMNKNISEFVINMKNNGYILGDDLSIKTLNKHNFYINHDMWKSLKRSERKGLTEALFHYTKQETGEYKSIELLTDRKVSLSKMEDILHYEEF